MTQVPVVEVRGLSMTFPGTRALDSVDLRVEPGEVHGLVGHNGSGKSTLIKILSGVYRPDGGSVVELGGQALPWESPTGAERLGLRVVHQHLGLVDGLSVTENLNLGSGYAASRFGRIAWRRENRLAAEQMAKLGYDVNPKTHVGTLPAAAQSAVAIARALLPRRGMPSPRILLLDEVTATMPETEIDRLLDLVRTLRAQGVAVLYVTHHLEEVLQVCESVTVLKDGRRVASTLASELTMTTLADQVVGSSDWRRRRPAQDSASEQEAAVADGSRLVVEDLRGLLVRGLSFSAAPGRIVGIAGISGSGREEVAQLLLGATHRGGTVTLGGGPLAGNRPRRAVKAGVTLVPADRARLAIVPTQNIRENLTLSQVIGRRGLSLLTARQEAGTVRDWISKLSIRSATPEGAISTLSGGNQQKVVLARCLNVKPRALILDEPTQGVDVGAVAEIHERIREISRHAAVVVCSSDSYELTSLCTEVIVLQRGHVVGHLHGDDITETNLDHLQLVTEPTPG